MTPPVPQMKPGVCPTWGQSTSGDARGVDPAPEASREIFATWRRLVRESRRDAPKSSALLIPRTWGGPEEGRGEPQARRVRLPSLFFTHKNSLEQTQRKNRNSPQGESTSGEPGR
jgi:hypothetical protein